MESNNQDRHILRDLALIYIALAHSTDQDLDDAEVDTIGRRLHAWQTEATSETVLGAIREALEAYVDGGGAAGVDRAVEQIRNTLSVDLRQRIVDDLVEVAMADDKFLSEESTFIEQLTKAWGVHVNDRPDEDGRKWSILSQDGRTGEWTPLHDLALVYTTLAHSTDDDLSIDEVSAITEKLREWMPDAKEVDVLNVVQEAMQAYSQGPDKRVFAESVEAVRKFVPEHQRPALLADLRYVAEADGEMLEQERALIERLSKAWEVAAEES